MGHGGATCRPSENYDSSFSAVVRSLVALLLKPQLLYFHRRHLYMYTYICTNTSYMIMYKE